MTLLDRLARISVSVRRIFSGLPDRGFKDEAKSVRRLTCELSEVGQCFREPGRQARRATERGNAPAADPEAGSAEKIAKPVSPEKRQPRNRICGCAALDVSGAFQQSLRPALKLQTRVLMRLAARKRGDPLHEIEQAFRRAAFLMQDGLDDLRRL